MLSTISSRFGGEAWIRTITHVPPLLLVLLMVGAAGQFSRVVKLASGAGLLSFVIHSGLALSDQSFASAKLPGYFEHYHKQQQSVPELIQFVVPLASSNCLVPDDYYTYDTLSIYFRNASLLSRPLGILVLNSENGKLRDYLKRNPAPESCKSGSIFLLLSRETLNSLEYQSLKSWIAIVRGMTASDFELQSIIVFKSTNERQFFALQIDAINNVR